MGYASTPLVTSETINRRESIWPYQNISIASGNRQNRTREWSVKTNNYNQKKLHQIENAPEITHPVTIRACEFAIVISTRPERHGAITSRIGKKPERADTRDIPSIGRCAKSSRWNNREVKPFSVKWRKLPRSQTDFRDVERIPPATR